MAVTTFALLAVLLVGFTLVVMGVQIARGDEEEDELQEDEELEEEDHEAESGLPAAPRLSEMAPGEAPTTALPVEGEDGILSALASLNCECGSPCTDVSPRFSEMRLGERALVSARWPCPLCARERTVYFELGRVA